MAAAAMLVTSVSSSSRRLIADVTEAYEEQTDRREPVVDRLADALGREFAERLVEALSRDALTRLDTGLSPAFAARLAALADRAA